jgi:hypothetical protein
MEKNCSTQLEAVPAPENHLLDVHRDEKNALKPPTELRKSTPKIKIACPFTHDTEYIIINMLRGCCAPRIRPRTLTTRA